MDWQYTRTETASAATSDFIAVVSRTTHLTRHGEPIAHGEWNGSLIRDSDLMDTTTVVATAVDKDRDSVIRALESYVQAFELARERDGQPHDGVHVDTLTRERDPLA